MTDKKRKNKIDVFKDKRITPIIGTVQVGVYLGHEFSLFGSADIPKGFFQSGISLSASGKIQVHHGCSFRYASVEEAMPLRGNLTEEIINYLNENKYYLRPIWAIPVKGKYKGVRYPLCKAEEVKYFFTPSGVRGVVNGFIPSHKSFYFTYVQQHEFNSPDKHNRLTENIVSETQRALSTPFIATIQSGELAGIQFGVSEHAFAHQHLKPRYVRTVLSGKRQSYKGCTFEVVSYQKAAEMTSAVTPEIIRFLEKKTKKRKSGERK